MDQVIIKNLNARGIIGINDWERVKKQEIRINIILYTDLQNAGESDNIKDSVNYRTVSKRVIKHAETAERYTVEALASDLAKICLAEKGVLRTRVRVEKPGAVRFSESVGVEIERGHDG
jgi:FolB domain-containing protein